MSTSTQQPVFQPPKGPPSEWTRDDLKKHVQTALTLELYTIPLYLFAEYSLKSSAPAGRIMHIVIQEMLHLALAGNLLCAVGGQPKLYGEEYVPQYPGEIFYQHVPLDLKSAKDNIENFKKIEAPLQPPVVSFAVTTLLPEYRSIGEFYESILTGLDYLSKQPGVPLFDPDSIKRQFQDEDGTGLSPNELKVIENLESARDALVLIIEQGEGNVEGFKHKDPGPSHYQVFTDLAAGKYGPLDCYNVVENPVTSNYTGEPIHPVMLLFDAAYCYLLISIEKMWTYVGPNPSRFDVAQKNMMDPMRTIITPLAKFLVSQPLQSNPEQHAAPAFNFYPFESTTTAWHKLQTLADDAKNAYPSEALIADAVQGIRDLLDVGSF